MKSQRKPVRQSVSLPSAIARRVRVIAEKRKASANRILVDLIEAGLRSKEAEKERFFTLANRLAESTDPAERRRIKKHLARITFGAL
jgi:predicted transcriptional regulator